MLFVPKNTHFFKFQKKKVKNSPSSGLHLSYGLFGLKVKQNGLLTSKQLGMLKFHLARGTKKIGRYWIRVFPHTPVTAKPLEVRMGKGKGYVDHYVCKIKRGVVLCELSGLSLSQASSLFKKISLKLPIRTIFVHKNLC